MTEAYGINWRRVAPMKNKFSRKILNDNYFHNVLSWFRVYPPLLEVFPSVYLSDLQTLIPIRNKIAHCRMLTDEEFQQLQQVYQFIIIGCPSA